MKALLPYYLITLLPYFAVHAQELNDSDSNDINDKVSELFENSNCPISHLIKPENTLFNKKIFNETNRLIQMHIDNLKQKQEDAKQKSYCDLIALNTSFQTIQGHLEDKDVNIKILQTSIDELSEKLLDVYEGCRGKPPQVFQTIAKSVINLLPTVAGVTGAGAGIVLSLANNIYTKLFMTKRYKLNGGLKSISESIDDVELLSQEKALKTFISCKTNEYYLTRYCLPALIKQDNDLLDKISNLKQQSLKYDIKQNKNASYTNKLDEKIQIKKILQFYSCKFSKSNHENCLSENQISNDEIISFNNLDIGKLSQLEAEKEYAIVFQRQLKETKNYVNTLLDENERYYKDRISTLKDYKSIDVNTDLQNIQADATNFLKQKLLYCNFGYLANTINTQFSYVFDNVEMKYLSHCADLLKCVSSFLIHDKKTENNLQGKRYVGFNELFTPNNTPQPQKNACISITTIQYQTEYDYEVLIANLVEKGFYGFDVKFKNHTINSGNIKKCGIESINNKKPTSSVQSGVNIK